MFILLRSHFLLSIWSSFFLSVCTFFTHNSTICI